MVYTSGYSAQVGTWPHRGKAEDKRESRGGAVRMRGVGSLGASLGEGVRATVSSATGG